QGRAERAEHHGHEAPAEAGPGAEAAGRGSEAGRGGEAGPGADGESGPGGEAGPPEVTREGAAMTRRAMWSATLLALAALTGAAGCNSGRYPVTGRVVYEDGSPLTEGGVVGEATVDGKNVMARGTVGSDGRFEWGTERPGDGARPGSYK